MMQIKRDLLLHGYTVPLSSVGVVTTCTCRYSARYLIHCHALIIWTQKNQIIVMTLDDYQPFRYLSLKNHFQVFPAYLVLLNIFWWRENQSTRSAPVNGQSRRAGSFLRTVRDRVNLSSIRWGVLGAEIQDPDIRAWWAFD